MDIADKIAALLNQFPTQTLTPDYHNALDRVLRYTVCAGCEYTIPEFTVDCGCGEGNSPDSCEGATPRVELLNDSDHVFYGDITAIELDGITYTRTMSINNPFGLPEGTISIKPLRRAVYFNELDWNWFYYLEVKNLDIEDHRVKLIGYTGNIDDPELQNDNPTLKTGESYVEFCLSPAANLVSCDGATNTAWFTDGSGTWDIEVDGTLYESPGGWGLGYFVSQEPTLSNMLYVSGDGDCIISSQLTDQPVRVKLIRKDAERWDIHEANENPTIGFDENGNISFCLAAAQIDPPELGLVWEKDSSGKIASVLRAQLNIDAFNVSAMDYDVFLLDENDEKLFTLKSETNVYPETRYFNFAESIAEILKSDQNALLKIQVRVTATGLDGSVIEREAGGSLKRISNRIALAKQNEYRAQRTRIFDVDANELPGYTYDQPPILNQGYLYSANQEYSDSVFLENISDNYLMVKVWMNPMLVEPIHASNDNECYVASGDYVTVELAPRQLEVLVIPSGAPDANRTVRIHNQTVLLYQYFEAKYGTGLIPDASMQIRFVVPEYQNIIIGTQDTAKWGSLNLHEGTPFETYLVALPSVGVLNRYQSYEYKAASGHAIIVGKTPTLGNLIFNDIHGRNFAWNNAKLLIDIRGQVIAAGGRGAPYFTDYNNPDGTIVTTGQDGWSPIYNINTDCKIRVIVDNGYLASGGGGAGISSAAIFHFARSDDPTQTKDLFVPAREGGGGAAFGDPSTLRNTGMVNNQFGFGATATLGGHLMLSTDNNVKCVFGAVGDYSEAWAIVAASTSYGGAAGKSATEAGVHTVAELNGAIEIAEPGVRPGTSGGFAGNVAQSSVSISVYCKNGVGGGISFDYRLGYPALDSAEWAF